MSALPPAHGQALHTRLIQAAHGGDAVAAADLFKILRERLLRILALDAGPSRAARADVEDLVQDSLLEAVRDFDTFRPRSSGDLMRWLTALARNNLRDRARWQRVRRGLESLRTSLASVLVDARQLSPASELEHRERRQRTDAALLRLSEPDRQILILRHYQMCSADEIARELGLPSAEAARARVARARRRLADLLGPFDAQ